MAYWGAFVNPDYTNHFDWFSFLSGNRSIRQHLLLTYLYCEKYKTAGHWVCDGVSVATMFYYEGEPYLLPFRAIFDEARLPWLKEAASLQIEAKIEEILFSRMDMEGN